jgi:hypothetical protein
MIIIQVFFPLAIMSFVPPREVNEFLWKQFHLVTVDNLRNLEFFQKECGYHPDSFKMLRIPEEMRQLM